MLKVIVGGKVDSEKRGSVRAQTKSAKQKAQSEIEIDATRSLTGIVVFQLLDEPATRRALFKECAKILDEKLAGDSAERLGRVILSLFLSKVSDGSAEGERGDYVRSLGRSVANRVDWAYAVDIVMDAFDS